MITDSHEWIKKDKNIATVGITKKASEEIGEIVYIELPKLGQRVKKGEEIVILESTKAAIDSYAPIDGTVIEVNEKLKGKPELVNHDPEGEGWLYKLQSSADK
jgi:glycine cleavage system H protein